VTPGAKKEIFKQKSVARFLVSVREKAERNMANKRVVKLVARHFNIPVNGVRIVNGHTHPSKLLAVEKG
jgi:uncharacterized protein YggU (UPF0235/DUF167 family)